LLERCNERLQGLVVVRRGFNAPVLRWLRSLRREIAANHDAFPGIPDKESEVIVHALRDEVLAKAQPGAGERERALRSSLLEDHVLPHPAVKAIGIGAGTALECVVAGVTDQQVVARAA